ncbi:hypothetical protein DFH07DRAFT_66497 [Mycena maculata]|uniref:Secreted protein n=1 Tax=Mycena maculata TaxID=230809 RepID=A0AAD7IEX7_9AGAR|nr:hypothetical protein DFH07DRAFT_66497 [Mycena maculata]
MFGTAVSLHFPSFSSLLLFRVVVCIRDQRRDVLRVEDTESIHITQRCGVGRDGRPRRGGNRQSVETCRIMSRGRVRARLHPRAPLSWAPGLVRAHSARVN